MFLKFFCLAILFFSYKANYSKGSNHGHTDVVCPYGTSPTVTKHNNEVKIVCIDKHGNKHKPKHKPKHKKIHKDKKIIAPVIISAPQDKVLLANNNASSNQTIIRHYYVPLQKKSEEAPALIEKRILPLAELPKKQSISDGFDGFFVGLMYNATILSANNNYTTYGPNTTASGTESTALLEHGPLITIGYSSLLFDKKFVVGAEVRMGYSVPNSNVFATSSTTINTYYQYNNFATSIFNWPSFHIRMGPLLFERFLPYFIAGIGVYQINYNSMGQLQSNGGQTAGTGGSQVSANFPVGAGFELAVSRHVHLRIEYLYTAFLPISNNFSVAQVGTSAMGINYNSSFSSHSILAGVMFCF